MSALTKNSAEDGEILYDYDSEEQFGIGKIDETGRDLRESTEYLGCSEQDLANLIQDKVVLDLGSGHGRFAAQMAYWSLIRAKSPLRVDSLNREFNNPEFQKYRDRLMKWDGFRLHAPKGVLRPLFRNQTYIDRAWKIAAENTLAIDWNDMGSISDEEYDVILSVFGFPFHSDSGFRKPESVEESGDFILDEKSKHVFRELKRIMKPGGIARLHWNTSYDLLKSSEKAQQELKGFFHKDLGIKIKLKELFNGKTVMLLEKSSDATEDV